MSTQRIAAAVVFLVGVVALVVGIIYLTVQAHSLPGILGPVHNYVGHRSKRGTAGVIVGAVLLVIGAGMFLYKPRAKT